MRGTRGFVALALFVSLIVAPALLAEEPEAEYTGNFTLRFEPAKSAALKPIEKQMREAHLFEETVEQLNDTIALPGDLEIVFAQCGTVNAFYDPNNTRVVMCYELLASFQKLFDATYEDKEAAEQATLGAAVFAFHHELGHALVHLLELPITGKEEDAVDDLATLVLLHDWEGGDESALSAAESFYVMGENQEANAASSAAAGMEKLPYYGEHSLGKQRYYEIACIVYGSDPAAHAGMVGDALPKERAVRCPSEYQQKAKSWDTLLADYYWAADEEEIEETSEKLMSGYSGEQEDVTMYQVVVNHEEQYSLWPADRELPLGWSAAGKTGTRQECLEYIRQKWTE